MTNDLLQYKQLQFVLHRGLLELRMLAFLTQDKKDTDISSMINQMCELTDILELIPCCMNRLIFAKGSDSLLGIIRQSFLAYKIKFPKSTFDYIRHLDVETPPEQY